MANLVLVVVAFLGFVNFALCDEIVHLKSGSVQSQVWPVGATGKVNLFAGIKYGSAKRFELAKPAEPWTEMPKSGQWGHSCPQWDPNQKVDNQDEDCLYLNVFQPPTENKNRSVMVFIHGGNFEGGTGAFDGRYLAVDGDVVVVGINYRLGPLGFLYAGVTGYEGNYGLHDQVLALQWVRDNIAAFGGNPNQVTIFGQSAGSWSVSALILSPLAKGLFSRAIMQSGAMYTASQSKAESLTYSRAFANAAGCPQEDGHAMVECLKEKPLADLHKVPHVWNLQVRQTTYGTDILPVAPSEALLTGKFNHVDLISGVCNNENADFMGDLVTGELTTKSIHDRLATQLSWIGADAEVADFYTTRLPKSPTENDLKGIITQAVSDAQFVCPTILFTEQMIKFATEKHVYNYRLMESTLKRDVTSWNAVPHSSDIYWIFPSETVAQTSLSKDIVRAFATFAKTGHPSKMGSVEWAPAATDRTHPSVQYMYLHTDAYKMVPGTYAQVCDVVWKPKQLKV